MPHVAVECSVHATDNGRHADASGEGDEVLWVFVPFRLPEGVSEIHHLQRVAGLEGRAEKSAGLTSANVLHDVFQPLLILVNNRIGSAQPRGSGERKGHITSSQVLLQCLHGRVLWFEAHADRLRPFTLHGSNVPLDAFLLLHTFSIELTTEKFAEPFEKTIQRPRRPHGLV